MRSPFRIVPILGLAILLCTSLTLSQESVSRQAEKAQQAQTLRTKGERKLDGALYYYLQLAEQSDTSVAKSDELKRLLNRQKSLALDSRNRIRVVIHLGTIADMDNVVSIIKSLGGEIEERGLSPFVIARIHPRKLRNLISLETISLIGTPIPGIHGITSIGDTQLGADQVRATYHAYGQGVKVGVMSDGITHLNNAQGAGELPTVVALSSGQGDEGTAMLEIVHDLAPLADPLYFYDAGDSYTHFANGIRTLRANGCKVIVNDVLYFDEPYFSDEDNDLGNAIRQFLSGGGVFVSAVMNFNYDPINNSVLGSMVFSEAFGQLDLNNFVLFPNLYNFLELEVPPTSIGYVFLQWATRWYSPTSDYDLLVYNDNDQLIENLGGLLRQMNSPYPPPREIVQGVTNSSSQAKVYRVRIKWYRGDQPPIDFKLTTMGGNILPPYEQFKFRNYQTDRKHILGHPGYPKVLGAAAYDSELQAQMAPYSSWGPMRCFSTTLNQWVDVQQTPVITATASVATYVGTSNLWPPGNPVFKGTSAAAPHIVGIAALYFSQFPTRTGTDFFTDITASAQTIDGEGGGAGWGHRAGYGKADAMACFLHATERAETPVFIPIPQGEYTTPFDVRLTTTTPPPFEIRYRRDAIEPTQSDLLYNDQTQIHVSATTTITAKVFKTGMQPSSWASATYTFTSLPLATRIVVNREDGTSYTGTFDLWTTAIPPSYWRSWPSGQALQNTLFTWTLRAPQDFLPSTVEKFWSWTLNSDQPYTYQNFGSVNINQNVSNTIVAPFKTPVNATIQSALLEGEGGSPGGTLDFKDPWLTDEIVPAYDNARRNRPASPLVNHVPYAVNNIGVGSAYKGMFTYQSGPPSWGSPCYSVIAPDIQQIGEFTLRFDHWEANPNEALFMDASAHETKVVFKQEGAIANARYKAHLASSLPSATGSNSQRVATTISPRAWFMVYPSGRDLYRTYSYDGGATWTQETRTTATYYSVAEAPSVAYWHDPKITSCDAEFDLVYRNTSGDFCTIMFCRPPLDLISIPTSDAISTMPLTLSNDPRPVIARFDYVDNGTHTPALLALWHSQYQLEYNMALLDGTTWNWLGERGWPGTEGCRNPSVSSPDLTVAQPELYIAYDNGNDLFILDEPNTGTLNCAVPASVGPTSYSSQVCADNRNDPQVHVVWEAYGEYGPPPPSTDGGGLWKGDGEFKRCVMYQMWNGTEKKWEGAHEFSSGISFYRPTISNLENGHLVWAWDGGSSTYKAVYDAGKWTLTEVYPDIAQPNLAISGSDGPIGTTRFVSTSTTGAPYRLVMGEETKDGPQASVIPERYSRRVVVVRKPSHRVRGLHNSAVGNGFLSGSDGLNERDTSSYISVELSPLSLKMRDGSIASVDFAALGDSVRDEQSIWQSLASQPTTLSVGIDSIIINGESAVLSPHRLSGVELGLSFDLVDADRGTVLRRIGTEQTFTSNGRGSLVRRERLVGVVGRRVFIRPSVRGFVGRSANLVSTIVHVHTLLMDSTSNPASALAKAEETRTFLPTAFALHQNYPNPFNPTTEIRFDLPNVGNVSLVVYDVLGRKIAELANGYREAGYHSATWNASGQSSGVYFARFNVANSDGRVAYSKVNKLVLMK